MHDRLRKNAVYCLILASTLVAASAAAADRIRLGLFDCTPTESAGLIAGTGTTLDCRLLAPGAASKSYAGLVETNGVDVAAHPDATLTWEIEATSADIKLDGSYTLAPAGSGAGAGRNRLIGGPDGAVTFIPASIVSQSGVNLASSVTRLKLKAK